MYTKFLNLYDYLILFQFLANGLRIIALNYLEVYPYDKWTNKQIHNYSQGQSFMPTILEMSSGQTSPPNLLTEADLISLMDKHGIGTINNKS